MGKNGFLTPKAIANRIKSKGLQKLRWFCQMCQKQCRDENGFKCHLTSESHQRQLLLFAENPDQYIDSFSDEFKDTFLELLRRRFGTKRVQANNVYQEYIADKEHQHMNSTQWETLTEFVKWLGREGLCTVDETEKGWFIQYIDRDWEAIKKQEAAQKKEKMDLTDEERTQRLIEKQIQRAQAEATERPVVEATELKRENEEEKIVLGLGLGAKPKENKEKPTGSGLNALAKLAEAKDKGSSSKKVETGTKRKSALEEIREFEEMKKEKMNRKDNWVHPNIVVKVVCKKLGDKYHKQKGVIKEVENQFSAVVKMIDTGDRIRVDQEYLETVIPALDKPVLIVNGAYRGEKAILYKINESKFSCSVEIASGVAKGRIIHNIQYEDLSKLYVKS